MTQTQNRPTVYQVGLGRMGQLVARSLAPHVDLVLAGRDPAKLASAAQQLGARSAGLDSDFTGAEAVIFVLPTETTVPVVTALAHRIPEGAIVMNVATAVMQKELAEIVGAERLAAAKFVGHYYDMAAGGKALLVVDSANPHTKQRAQAIMAPCAPVIEGREEWVLTANRTATEEAVRMAIRIQRRLEQASIPKEIAHQAAHGVAVGSLRAFLDGKLGPFGQTIADRVVAELDVEATNSTPK